MSERKIKVLSIGDVYEGMYVAHVDDDFPYGTFVPSDAYDAEEQDWLRVVERRGYVDLPTLLLEYHNGEREASQWQSSASVWVLCDEDGKPVEHQRDWDDR